MSQYADVFNPINILSSLLDGCISQVSRYLFMVAYLAIECIQAPNETYNHLKFMFLCGGFPRMWNIAWYFISILLLHKCT